MTCIVGLVDNGNVYLGGDAAGVGGYMLQTRSDPKVFRNGDFLMGYTSSFRMGQLLEYHLTPPGRELGMSSMQYMVTRFIPGVRACFDEHGFQRTLNSVESGGTFLVGYRGELFEIEDDYQVARVAQGYCAVGCGMDLALGSLHTTHQYKITPTDRVRMALEAAAEFSAGVSPPFTILEL